MTANSSCVVLSTMSPQMSGFLMTNRWEVLRADSASAPEHAAHAQLYTVEHRPVPLPGISYKAAMPHCSQLLPTKSSDVKSQGNMIASQGEDLSQLLHSVSTSRQPHCVGSRNPADQYELLTRPF